MLEEKKHPWLNAFLKNPVEALGALLSGQFYMGTLNVARPPDILEGWARGLPESDRFIETLDRALLEWLRIRFRKEPHLPASLFARALVDAFSLVARIDMPLTLEWLREDIEKLRLWLRPFYLGKTRDPEGNLLRTLALKQPDRSLLPVWYRLVDLSEPLPIYYHSLGILGLRCMPDSQGAKQRDINPEVFVGILRLAKAMQKRSDGQNLWKRELQSLMAIYPRSGKYWCDNFLPLMEGNYSDVYAWLAPEIPSITGVQEQFRKGLLKGADRRYMIRRPPGRRETNRLLDLLDKVSYKEFREKVKDLQSRHRKVAQETGDMDTFVIFSCNMAKNIQSKYVKLAEELVTEANLWAPYDPFTWTQLENIYLQQGDFQRAELVGYQAYHRFPENVYVHTGLAETLKAQGKLEEAEFVYRKTVEKFPDNVVAYNGLAEILKAKGKYKEAEDIYKKAKELSPSNIYARSGLAYILKLQERYPEAQALYSETIEKFPDDVVAYTGLAETWKAQGNFEKAEEIYRKSKQKFPTNPFSYVGLAVVLLRSNYKEAISLLEEAIDKFPTNKYAPAILAKVKEKRGDYAGAEKILKEAYENEIFEARCHLPISKDEEVPPVAKVAGVTPKVGPLPLDLSPIAVGFGSLYRHYGRWLQKKRSISAEKFFALASQWIKKALEQNPINLYALAEKGWLLADCGDISGALSHFEQASRQYPHNAAFHLGLVRMKVRQKTIEPDSSEWDKLEEEFLEFKQVFRLEQARYGLQSPNGYTRVNLSKLQRVLTLPQWIAESEKNAYKWFIGEVKDKLFHNIEPKDEYPLATIEQLRTNNEEYGVELDELAEVYVARAV